REHPGQAVTEHRARHQVVDDVVVALPFAANLVPQLAVGAEEADAFEGGGIGRFRHHHEDRQRDHNVVYYLVASAVFRDGLAGVFAFGAVLGVNVYGISQADVLLFGISACVIAAIGAVTGGLLDDRVGSKPVIVGSLVCLIAVGLALLVLSGPVAFWVCGLLLCLFIGPTLSAARNLMLRITADGKEGVAFGLYTTVGRAASFLAPWLFFTFIDLFGADRAGMGGLVLVLAVGLAGMLAVRVPARHSGPAVPTR
ncbi:MFS transporter, partial [Mycolicibacterium conceptionense]|uniref:MFS transporter n=1 Tax=Mycolicibacterium conceptionense TaxID=451644 RepID=UPI0020C3D4DB